MVSDYSIVIGRQSQETRQKSTATFRGDVKLKRPGEKEVFDKEWQSERSSSGTSLPLLLTFGWTFRWDPPSWLLLGKVRQRERGWKENVQQRRWLREVTLKQQRRERIGIRPLCYYELKRVFGVVGGKRIQHQGNILAGFLSDWAIIGSIVAHVL